MSRDFHLGDILSVTTEKLVSPRHIEGVYDILNFMTGDNLFTHQLIRAGKEARPVILEQHPQLKEVDESDCGPDTWKAWLDKQIADFGETLPITPMAEWVHVDPLIELRTMTDKPIIRVQI